MDKFKEEKRNYDHQKEDIMSDIDDVRQNVIIAKSKNSIHEKKIAEYMKKIMELNNRRDYILSVYSAASNNSVNNGEQPTPNKEINSIYYDDTFQGHPGIQNPLQGSFYPDVQNSIQSNRKIVDNENMLVQIEKEKNKLSDMEKDLEGLKAFEYLLLNNIFNR